MLAATISQIAFALAYRAAAHRGRRTAFGAGSAAFSAATLALAVLHWPAIPTFAAVVAALAGGGALIRRPARLNQAVAAVVRPPRWDIPVRMTAATTVVLAITTLAPVIGPRLTGLLTPFLVFGAVLAVFTHHTHGPAGATAVLDGLIMGLAAPAVFFLVLALTLPPLGLAAFAIAALAALTTQVGTVFAIPAT